MPVPHLQDGEAGADMCIIPRVFRRIGNKIIRLSLLITKTRRAKQLFSLLSYLYIYARPPLHGFSALGICEHDI